VQRAEGALGVGSCAAQLHLVTTGQPARGQGAADTRMAPLPSPAQAAQHGSSPVLQQGLQ
jgi:hypothetical protein